MNEFLKKLYDTDNTLSLLLLEAKEIAENNNDTELVNYIEKEIDGYKIEDGLPEYRKVKSEIVCNIKDVFGNMVYIEKPVDFSLLSEKVGIDLDISHVPDGISFIETYLKKLTGTTSVKQIPDKLVKMLDETFHFNNNHLHLATAYYRLPTATIDYILVRVRHNLIQSFQKLKRKVDIESKSIISDETVERIVKPIKSVFVTYAWSDEESNSLVISFVDFLRKNSFDASMDKKKSQEETAINFNQMMIEGIKNNDKVVVILSEKYKERADKFEGGVGTEFKIILEDMKKNKNKYVFASFGLAKREDVTPIALMGIDILNLKEDQDKYSFNNLFSKLKEENLIEFSDVIEKEIEVKKIEIKPFKL